MKSLRRRSTVNGERDWNHLRLLAELAEDAGVAVLHERADSFCGVGNLERIERRGKRGQNLCLGHWQVDHAELQQGMSARQKMLRINVRDGAGCSDIHVAANENCTYGRAGLERIRLFCITG